MSEPVNPVELEIRQACAAAIMRMGMFDDTRVSVKTAGLLGNLDFTQFKAVLEAACRRDSALWQRICELYPPAEATDFASRMRRLAMEPLIDGQLREVHARLKTKGQMKLVREGA